MKYSSLLLIMISVVCFSFKLADNPPALKFALLKYSGGGDWYSNPTALPNLA